MSGFYKIQNKLHVFSAKISSGQSFNCNQYEELRQELENHEKAKCRGAVLRSRAKWAVESDKNTSYFLRLEKFRQESNSIKTLRNSVGNELNTCNGISDEIFDFCNSLYNCVNVEDADIDKLLSYIHAKVGQEDKIKCDAPISMEEIKSALLGMSKNKSPGLDGLTVEFYCHFFDILQGVFCRVIESVRKERELSRTMRQGVN